MHSKPSIVKKSIYAGLVVGVVSALIAAVWVGFDDSYIGVIIGMFGVAGFAISSCLTGLILVALSKNISQKAPKLVLILIGAVVILYFCNRFIF